MTDGLVLFEDEHLLVINKPAGLNTHSPSPYGGEGIYEWLKNREPRWANLAIIHRLDKETSGVMVFGKSTLANRSLTQQFESRAVSKKYLLVSDKPLAADTFTAKSTIVRAGERYVSRPLQAGTEIAETLFNRIAPPINETIAGNWAQAMPLTGRTHQIRVHAAEHGFPILGDTLYGGAPAARVYLHAHTIEFQHPATGQLLKFTAPPNFDANPRQQLRQRLIDTKETNAFRLSHGAADGWPSWYIDRLGPFLLSQSERPLDAGQTQLLKSFLNTEGVRGVYHKTLNRHVRGAATKDVSPQFVFGEAAGEEVVIRENDLQFSIRFSEGYSVGIFLDQRDNRRRLITGYISPAFEAPLRGLSVLNTFAYTCAFSVAAAKAGARVTSLDLSKKYLDWGKRNFELNQLNPADHDFIFGDVFDWLRRFGKKQRSFDAVLLDPPTFSQSKEHGVFRAEKDYGKLIEAALEVLRPGGLLFASTNAAELKPELFLEKIRAAVTSNGRKISREHFQAQPPDFPITRDEPGYLKTVWLRVT